MGDISARVADYIAEASTTLLPADVAEKAILHLLDTLAAMVSGSTLKAGRQALAFVESIGGREEATVAGTGILTDAIHAALANGMAAHADETDDSHLAGRFHPGCAVVPAALATSERFERSGDALLRAVVCGYDVGARFTMALGFSGPRTGTHSTHSLGANFGATAAAGALAGLDAAQCHSLLSYAVQQASGLPYWQRDPEHVEKAFDFGGMGARNGVTAALMVAAGCSGVPDPLSGKHSYLSGFAENPNPQALTAELGTRFEIMGASIKKWSVGSPIQAALDSLAALIAEHDLTGDNVARLEAHMPDDRLPIVDDREMPDVCLQHLLAVMLADGELTFRSSHDRSRMAASDIRDIRSRIKAVPSAELTLARPARQAIIKIETRDGRQLTRRTRAVRGTPDNPMSVQEVVAKARELIAPVLGDQKVERLIETVLAITEVSSVRDLRPLLRP